MSIRKNIMLIGFMEVSAYFKAINELAQINEAINAQMIATKS